MKPRRMRGSSQIKKRPLTLKTKLGILMAKSIRESVQGKDFGGKPISNSEIRSMIGSILFNLTDKEIILGQQRIIDELKNKIAKRGKQ